jgi:hypothetical protein
MKSPGRLPTTVRHWLERHIDSVEQLETLLFLEREQARFWSGADIARALQLDLRTTVDDLERLARRGLLDVRIASDVIYRFSPTTPVLLLEVKAMLDAYAQSRGPLLAFVASRHRRALKDFSDAFRWTRDSGDG